MNCLIILEDVNKPNTIPTSGMARASLAQWLACYPFMADNPRLWFVGYLPTAEDRAEFAHLFRHDGTFRSASELCEPHGAMPHVLTNAA